MTGPYASRPPCIHLAVNAPGLRELLARHHPGPGPGEAAGDLVLIPAP